MKPFPAGLDTLLATRSFVFADLYDFLLSDGSAHLLYTTADADVLYLGSTYTSKGPFFDDFSAKSVAHWKTGMDVDTWQVDVMPLQNSPSGVTATIYGQPWLSAVRAGALRGATVDVHRAYWAAWPVPWSSPLVPTYVLVDIFAGRVADIVLDRTKASISINSHMEILTRSFPRNHFQPGCVHTLFDSGCTLTRASFAVGGSVSAVTNNGDFTTNLTNADSYFSLGMITWLTGANTGFSIAIRNYFNAGGECVLLAPMPFTVAPGDTFNAYPGCDKTQSTCTTKFSNLVNFKGEPYIPSPEVAV